MNITIAERVYASRERLLTRKRERFFFIFSLVITDVCIIALALAVAYLIRYQSNLPFFDDGSDSLTRHEWLAATIIPLWIFIFFLFGLYDLQYLLGGTIEYARTLNASAVVLALVVVFTYLFPIVRISRGWLVIAIVTGFFLLVLSRFTMRRIGYALRRRGHLTMRTLIIGTNEEARAIARQIESAPTAGAELIGFVDNGTPYGTHIENKLAVVSGLDALPGTVQALRAEQLILSTSALSRDDAIRVFQMFGQSHDVQLRFASGLFEVFTSGIHVNEIGSVPLVTVDKFRLDGLERVVKASMDYALAFILLLVLSPIMLVLALLIHRDSPGPILHRRQVLGRGDKPFYAYKFRTMYVDGDEIIANHPELRAELGAHHKLKEDPRVTKLGRVLRRYSLDELPQLFNVLQGQMSLVGPRMITPIEGEKYGRWRMNLLAVKPGLTGLWQISGRSDISYEDRIRLDMHYISHYSIWTDFQILLQTIPAVLRGRGAY